MLNVNIYLKEYKFYSARVFYLTYERTFVIFEENLWP